MRSGRIVGNPEVEPTSGCAVTEDQPARTLIIPDLVSCSSGILLVMLLWRFLPILAALFGTANGQAPATPKPNGDATRVFWDEKFRSGLPNVAKEPNRLLVEAVAKVRGGSALDLGCGDGRNLLYLAAKGWAASGVDISEVAVALARERAVAAGVKTDLTVSDLDQFEIGENRWDLLLSIYMQDWHLKSKTNTFARMKKALRPGGLVVIEGFGPPNGLKLDDIKQQFAGFSFLRAEIISDDPDWGKGRGIKQIVRVIARK
jgi:SAM-dependent methyltransferase